MHDRELRMLKARALREAAAALREKDTEDVPGMNDLLADLWEQRADAVEAGEDDHSTVLPGTPDPGTDASQTPDAHDEQAGLDTLDT